MCLVVAPLKLLHRPVIVSVNATSLREAAHLDHLEQALGKLGDALPLM